VLEKLPFQVEVVQTDNGAEFQGALHWHLLDRGIGHVYGALVSTGGRRRPSDHASPRHRSRNHCSDMKHIATTTGPFTMR
jgi:hypothetical protein